MSESIFDDDSEAASIRVDAIRRRADTLPETEQEFLLAVEAIADDIRGLFSAVMSTPSETVKTWIELLKNVPEKIGIRPEFSSPTQIRIDEMRGRIETTLDETWPEIMGTCICDGDSGINLQDDSGINIGIL